MAKDSMIFYKSTADALSKLDDSSYKKIMTSIFAYAFEGIQPELDGVCEMAWLLIRPQIDACIRRYDAQISNGRKGGRKPKQNPNETQIKPKQNPSETFNYNDNYNFNDNENDDDEGMLAGSSKTKFFDQRVKLGWKKREQA